MSFGLDISDASIEALQLKKGIGRIKVKSFSRIELPIGVVLDGKILNKDKLVEAILLLLSQGRPRKISEKKVILSLPESKVFTYVFELPANLSRKEIAQFLKEEAGAYIPIDLSQANLDFFTIFKTDVKQEVFFVAVEREIVENLSEVLERSGLDPIAFDMESACLARAMIRKYDQGVLIVDCGARTTIISIFDKNGIRSTTNIPIAGNKFTEAISQQLKIPFSRAEKLKKTCGLSATKRDRSCLEGRIFLILQSVIQPIVLEIKKSISHYETISGRKIKAVYLAGGSALLSKFDQYLSENLALPTKVATKPWLKIEIPDGKMTPLLLNAIGLALRGLERDPENAGINLRYTLDKISKAKERSFLALFGKERAGEEVRLEKAKPKKEKKYVRLERLEKKEKRPKVEIKEAKKIKKKSLFVRILGFFFKLGLILVIACLFALLVLYLLYPNQLDQGIEKIKSFVFPLIGRKAVLEKEISEKIDLKFEVTTEESEDKVDLENNIILGKIQSHEVEDTRKFLVKKEEGVEGRAAGRVTITNDSDEDQPLVSQTRLLSENDVLFRLKNDVTVQAHGGIEAEVLADVEGEEGEIEPTKFKLPGLSRDLQEKIYAESKEKMVLETASAAVLEESDVEEAREKMKEDLAALALEKAEEGIRESGVLLPDYLNFEILETKTDPEIGKETSEFEIKIRARVDFMILKFDEIRFLAEKNLLKNLRDGGSAEDYMIGNFSYKKLSFESETKKALVEISCQALRK